jgi:hypothetical protein
MHELQTKPQSVKQPNEATKCKFAGKSTYLYIGSPKPSIALMATLLDTFLTAAIQTTPPNNRFGSW